MESQQSLGLTVLVIADDEQMGSMLHTCLEQEGFLTIIAQTAQQALDLALQTSPDLIINYVSLPNLEGFDLCQRFKRQTATKAVPQILLLNSDDPADMFKGFQKGAVDCIAPPLTAERIIQQIQPVLQASYKAPPCFLDSPKHDIEDISLLEVLRICQDERLDGTICMTKFGRSNKIFLNAGEITTVQLDTLPKEIPFDEILQWKWKDGNFAVEAEELDLAEEEPALLKHYSQRPRVLLVDHDRNMLQHLSQSLDADYAVCSTEHGKEALEIIREHKTVLDLLLISLNLPDIHEFDLLIEAKKVNPNLQVIIMTDKSSAQTNQKASEQGALLYVQKTVMSNQVKPYVQQALQPRKPDGFRGEIQTFNLVDIVQMYCIGRVKASLVVNRLDNGIREHGIIYFDEGRITDVLCGDLSAEEAFTYLISWKHGDFTTEYGVDCQRRTIHKSWEALLLDASKSYDETCAQASETFSEKAEPPSKPEASKKAVPSGSRPKKSEQTGKQRKEVSGMATKTEQLQQVLQEIKSELKEAEMIAIVASDGTVFATNAGDADSTKIGAMVATFIGLSRKACQTLKKGEPTEGLIKGEQGYIAIYPAGKKADLGVTTQSSANLAMLNMVCRDAAEKIRTILG